MPDKTLPLAGIRVLDLGQIYQGPYATFLMARAGAEIIKIEPPEGEPLRRRALAGEGASLPFALLNVNKRDVTLNLKSTRGRELLLALVETADVLIENFAPGVMDRLGVGAAVLMARNSRLVYASGTGFGLSGPDRDRLAMDLTVQAVAGAMSVTGFPDGPPLKAGPAIADFLSGTHLYAAVVTALLERLRTGRGRLVEVAMQEAVYPALASNLGMMYAAGLAPPPRTGNRHGGLSIAPYNVYPASDGHIAILCVVEQHWRNLAEAMGRPDLAEHPDFATNAARVARMDETDALVAAWSSALTRQQVFDAAQSHRVPCAPVRDLVEVTTDRHLHARGALVWLDDPDFGRIAVPTGAPRYHGAAELPLTPAPRLGADNREILGGLLGLSEDEIAALAEEGAI
jgi:crotonobetainyl-CoA:carnitine CoA-transferase CaiB-like acyl-CoA transferase